MKCLHICIDEKFIDSTIEKFETINSGENEYIIKIAGDKSLKYVKSGRIEIVRNWYSLLRRLQNRGNELIIFHSLSLLDGVLLLLLPSRVKVLWLCIGKDIYNPRVLKDFSLYLPETKRIKGRIVNSSSLYKKKLTDWLTNLLLVPLFRLGVRRIDYCSTVLPNEFKLLSKLYFFKARQVYFNYGGVFQGLSVDDSIELLGDFLWLGNSSSLTGNHMDAMMYLKKIGYSREVIVPLSYGNSSYRDYIIKTGQSLFGDQFKAILDYCSLEEYRILQKKCKHAVFFNERQEGLGTIILLLFQGSKVFLSVNNPVYEYLKELNVNIFSVQQDLDINELRDGLTIEQIRWNRNCLISKCGFGEIQIGDKINAMLSIITRDIRA